MDCSKLNQNINSDCPEAMRQFRRVGWISDRESLFNVVKNGFTVSFETKSGFYPIYDRSMKPFNGTKSEIVEADYYNKTNETVQFPILLSSPENSETVNILKNGKAIVILEQVSEGENGISKYPIFGLDGGLYPQELPSDSASDVAWVIKLQEENTTQYGYFLYDTSESSTKILLDRLNNNIIEGLSIRSGRPINISIDTDKRGYVFYSNGNKLSTVNGVLAATSSAYDNISISIPRDNEILSIEESAFTGILVDNYSKIINISNTYVSAIKSKSVESIFALQCGLLIWSSLKECVNLKSLDASGNLHLSSIDVPTDILHLDLHGCSITANAIKGYLANPALNNMVVNFNFLGGNNAGYNDLDSMAKGFYSTLISNGSTIQIKDDPFAFTPYTLGQEVEGGKVAYILQPTDSGYDAQYQKCIIASMTDLYETFEWGGSGTLIGTTSESLMEGTNNTNEIVSALGAYNNYAARLCSELTLNSKSDWVLPSLSEFIEVSNFNFGQDISNQHILGMTGVYWTSSETAEYDDGANKAWSYDCTDNGSNSKIIKTSLLKVRPIRYAINHL